MAQFLGYQGLVAAIFRNRWLLVVELSEAQRMRLAEICETLLKVDCNINYRTPDIIRRRYGIGMSHETLKKIADSYGITPERVRQIEARGLRWLKHPVRSRVLRVFLAEVGFSYQGSR